MKQYIHNTFPVCLRFLCATMLVALAMTACQKEDETVTLDAVIADQPNRSAKVYVNSFYSYWHNGDNVYINGNTSDDKYTLSVTKASPVIAKIEDVETSTKYTAGYPAEYTEITGNGSLNITLPETQTYELGQIYSNDVADKAQSIVTPMAAYTEGTTLRFHNVGALIKVEIENKINQTMTLYAVEVESDKAPLSGTLAVTATEGGVSIGTTTDGKKRVSMRFSGSDNVVLDASSGDGTKTATIYIPILSIAETQKSNLTVHVMATGGDSKKYTFHGESASDQGVWIARNAMGSISCELNTTTCSGENAYFWGKGTPECPYMIENYTDLNNLRTLTNAGTSGYYGNSVYYKQTSDITITSSTWGSNSDGNYAIGNSSKAFTANYDGDEKYIRLSISNSTNNSNLGVFGIINGNAKIKNVKVRGSISTSGYYCNDGCVVGQITGPATVENCYNECNINDTYNSSNSTYGRGGIVGLVKTVNESDVVKILSSINVGSIEATTNCAGGIVGNIYKGTVTVKNCTNGSESNASSGTIITQENYAGGVCGYVYYTASGSEIDRCINYGTVKNKTTTSAKNNYLGGILGYFRATSEKEIAIKNCENHGAIDQYRTAYSTFKMYAGGIVAALYAYDKNETGTINISSCSNMGVITSQTSNNYSAEMRAGGIIGWISGQGGVTAIIDRCNNSGSIRSNSVSGNKYAGGIVGVQEVNTISNITNCYNTGDFSSNFTYGGGMVGYLANGTTSSIVNSYYIGNEIPDNKIGGAIGFVTNNVLTVITVQNYYVTFGNNKKPRGTIIGHLSGSNPTCNVNNCFVDNNHRTVPAAYYTAISPTDYYAYDNSYNLRNISDGTTNASYEGTTTLLDALNYYRTHPTHATWKEWLQESTSVVPHF